MIVYAKSHWNRMHFKCSSFDVSPYLDKFLHNIIFAECVNFLLQTVHLQPTQTTGIMLNNPWDSTPRIP